MVRAPAGPARRIGGPVMRTFEVTFTDGSTETYYAERIQLTPTHIVLDNTERSFGIDNRGICIDELETAIVASTALIVEEIGGASWRRPLQQATWDDGDNIVV